jgi:hypothetical protein
MNAFPESGRKMRRYLKMVRQSAACGSDKWQTWEVTTRSIIPAMRRIKSGACLRIAVETLLPQP